MAIEMTNAEFRKIMGNKQSDIMISHDEGEEKVKNKLSDLNNHLFAQLERLGDEDLTAEQLQSEIGRSKAITDVANSIINNAKTVLDAAKFAEECGFCYGGAEGTLSLLGMGNQNGSNDQMKLLAKSGQNETK